jgi:hypothetical protein
LGVLKGDRMTSPSNFCNQFILLLFLIKVGVFQDVRLETKGMGWVRGKASTEALGSLEGYFL